MQKVVAKIATGNIGMPTTTRGVVRSAMILRTISDFLISGSLTPFRIQVSKVQTFDNIIGYEGIKRTFVRSLNSNQSETKMTNRMGVA